MTTRSGQTTRITKRPSAKKLREPETFLGLDMIGRCGKCGGKLPVTKKKTKAGVIYVSRHLCFVCEPAPND